ncbi:MAG: citrate/2-methylcitrate synthase [Acutalibacteraceae bacterium]|jgi:citrate synthase
MLENASWEQRETIHSLCSEYRTNNHIDPAKFERYDVKRGLRNQDGTGVMAGLTLICNVHGYVVRDNERIPDEGELTYRGINIRDIIAGAEQENRFGYEEVVWLLLFGTLPTRSQLEGFIQLINSCRELPPYFAEDMIMKAPSPNIMNKLARSVLTLYSYDDMPEDISLENIMMQSINLIAKLPTIMSYAYQVKRRYYDHESMFFHQINPEYGTAESILRALRPDQKFTAEEAHLLDLCLMLHAEHGGGNNSTFAARVLASSGTDTYSVIGAAIGSLKGPRHGGANHRVMEMMNEIKNQVRDWTDDEEISAYLAKIVRKEAGDGSGLIYGMGHAIYTLSDPRAVELKKRARKLAEEKGMLNQLQLFERVERLAPGVFARVKGDSKVISANVDFYSGLVYEMLGIPSDLYTPLFAVARMAGWCAHRIEETVSGGRIMRPAYKSVSARKVYVPLDER